MSKELQIGHTKIGTSPRTNSDTGEIVEFEVYYGNVCLPLVDNEIKHLPNNEYLEMLAQFLQSEEGVEYEVPTATQIEEASNTMVERELSFRKQNETKEETPQVPESPSEPEPASSTDNNSTAEEEIPDQSESDENSNEEDTVEEQEETPVVKNEYKARNANKLKTHPNPSYEKLYRALVKKQGKIAGLRVALIIFILLFTVSAVSLFYLVTNFYNLLENKQSQITVNGEIYTIPLSVDELSLENGDSEFYVFGLSVKKDEEGNLHQTVIPFGQLNDQYSIEEEIHNPNTEETSVDEENSIIPEKENHSTGQIKVENSK